MALRIDPQNPQSAAPRRGARNGSYLLLYSVRRKYYACLDISSVVVEEKRGGWSEFSDEFRLSWIHGFAANFQNSAWFFEKIDNRRTEE